MNVTRSVLVSPIGLLVFACAAFVSFPNCSAAFELVAEAAPAPIEPRQYQPGSSIRLTIGYGSPPSGAYQWFHDNQAIAGATDATLTLTNLSSSDAGNYRLRITTGKNVEFSANTQTVNVVTAPAAPIDSGFSTDLPADRRAVRFMSGARDGSLIVVCIPKLDDADFGNSRSAVRLHHDGSRDHSFHLWLGTNSILEVLPNGELITAHSPYRIGNDATPRPIVLPPAFDSSKPLTHAVAQPNGAFFIAQGESLARMRADGMVDATFTAVIFGQVDGLRLDSAGKLIVVSSKIDVGNVTERMDRLLPDGSRDTAFAARNGVREYYYPEPLVGGGLVLQHYWGNFVGPYLQRLDDNGVPLPGWTDRFAHRLAERLIVDPVRPNTLWSPDLQRFSPTDTGIARDPTFYAGINGRLELVLPDGKLLARRISSPTIGTTAVDYVRLRTTDLVNSVPPVASVTPERVTPAGNSTLVLTGTATGTGPFTYQWLALDGQPLPAVSTSPELIISNFAAAHLGRYQLRVTGAGGVSVLSNVVSATVGEQPCYLANLSGRAIAGTGENTIIAGLSTSASGIQTVLRGAGPALGQVGIANYLGNPAINVFDGEGRLLANNDQWSLDSRIGPAASAVGAFPFDVGSNDAALLHSLGGRNATLHLVSQNGDSGVSLVEIYRTATSFRAAELLNLSFRARTGPGDQTAIAGFVITDPANFDRRARVLLRAIGPTLAASGIAHALENPVLTVYNSKGEIVASNDDWPSHLTAEVTPFDEASAKVGAFSLPYGSKDSGLLLDLPAGAYSMHASGGTGVVLLEIYVVR